MLEVHGEERHIGKDIAVTKTSIELQAIQDSYTAVHHEDVLRQQVAVAIPDVAVFYPAAENCRRPWTYVVLSRAEASTTAASSSPDVA